MMLEEMPPWHWVEWLNGYGFHYWLPGLLLAAGLWIAYRAVNYPAIADFLIAVEAEMNKVSWPSRGELFRASMVVLFTIFFLAGVLFALDTFWQWFFEILNVFPQGEAMHTAVDYLELDWRVFLS
jgi:preprotein translocase SecE subunit